MRTAVFLLLPALMLAADKEPQPVQAGNDSVELTGSVITGREQVGKVLGVDPGFEIIAVNISVTAKEDSEVRISRDDFTLISRRDGQKSQGMHPSQIAGSGTMMVSSRAPGAGGGLVNQNRGPIWGGVPGTGTRPRRIGGDADVATASDGETRAAITNAEQSDNPVLAALKKNEVAEGAVKGTASGLLYFLFEGKHKIKDLELMYKGPGGTLMLDFQK